MTAHTPAQTPTDLHAILADSFNRADIDASLVAYEKDSLLVVPPDGEVVRGRDNIRKATEPLFALRPHMNIEVAKVLEAGDLALAHARWTLTATDPAGQPVELSGRGTMVSRRQPDGTWRIVLDDPLTPA